MENDGFMEFVENSSLPQPRPRPRPRLTLTLALALALALRGSVFFSIVELLSELLFRSESSFATLVGLDPPRHQSYVQLCTETTLSKHPAVE